MGGHSGAGRRAARFVIISPLFFEVGQGGGDESGRVCGAF